MKYLCVIYGKKINGVGRRSFSDKNCIYAIPGIVNISLKLYYIKAHLVYETGDVKGATKQKICFFWLGKHVYLIILIQFCSIKCIPLFA